MPIKTFIDSKNRFVYSCSYGTVTNAEMISHEKKMNSHPDYDGNFCQLVDARNIKKNEINAEGIRVVAKMTKFSTTTRRAYLVNEKLETGYSNMYSKLTNAEDEYYFVTNSLEDALEWLNISEETYQNAINKADIFSD